MKSFTNRSQSGLTLVETVVAIGIYTILIFAITASMTSLYKMNSYALGQANEVDNARRGMTQWNRDVKEMTVGEDGTFPIAIIEEHKLGYYSDTDQDDDVEYIEYILASTTLTKYVYKATGNPPTYDLSTPASEQILSLFVQNIKQATSTFFYYDETGAALNAASSLVRVKYIKAQIIVNIDPMRSPGEFLLRSSIAPRNLKENL